MELEKDYTPTVNDGDVVKSRQAIAVSGTKKALRSPITGKVKIIKIQLRLSRPNRLLFPTVLVFEPI